jgi:hypothetical protein
VARRAERKRIAERATGPSSTTNVARKTGYTRLAATSAPGRTRRNLTASPTQSKKKTAPWTRTATKSRRTRQNG